MRHKYMLFASMLILTAVVTVYAEEKKDAFSYEDLTSVLKTHVDNAGMVNYKGLKREPKKLLAYIASVSKFDPNSYQKFNEKEKIAFWLNAYNAFTLKAIIDNYPIKARRFTSMYYPKNSIRQIPGVWDKLTFIVMGKGYTLAHIEHNILRKEFNEPRIHMAMVCAALGCPPLSNEPYLGKRLNEQLDEQSKKFLANPAKFKFDPNKRRLYISPIFKWFGNDFIKVKAKARSTNKERAILEFVNNYLDKDHPFFSPSKKAIKIKYLDYDWSLNEQKK